MWVIRLWVEKAEGSFPDLQGGTISLSKPADATHLVVCIVGSHGAPTVAGRAHLWTANVGISTHRVWAWQGDGTVPSVDVSWTGGRGDVILFSFAGFQTSTPTILFDDGSAQTAATTAPVPGATSPEGSHAVLTLIALQNGVGSLAMTGEGWAATQPMAEWDRVKAAALVQEGAATPPGVWEWGINRTYRRVMFAWPAEVPPPPQEIASLSMLGDMPVVARYLGDAPVWRAENSGSNT